MSPVDALIEPATLARVLDREVVSVRVEPLTGIGFSNASLSRMAPLGTMFGAFCRLSKFAILSANFGSASLHEHAFLFK